MFNSHCTRQMSWCSRQKTPAPLNNSLVTVSMAMVLTPEHLAHLQYSSDRRLPVTYTERPSRSAVIYALKGHEEFFCEWRQLLRGFSLDFSQADNSQNSIIIGQMHWIGPAAKDATTIHRQLKSSFHERRQMSVLIWQNLNNALILVCAVYFTRCYDREMHFCCLIDRNVCRGLVYWVSRQPNHSKADIVQCY